MYKRWGATDDRGVRPEMPLAGQSSEEVEKVPVLIVGGGGAGLTASMLMSTMGIDTLLVSSLPTTSVLPKAHVLNQRAMEIMNDCGVADAIYAVGTPPEAMSHAAFYGGFAGHPEAGTLLFKHESWGCGGLDEEWAAASPMVSSNLPQIRLEPILKARAEGLAPSRVRFHHEVTRVRDTGERVRAHVVDRTSDTEYLVEADYVIACDGGRTIGGQVGIALEGNRDLARTASLYVVADLSRWSKDRDVLLRWHWCPEIAKMIVIAPMGPTRWGGESEEWVIHINYPMDDARALDDDAVLSDVRLALGIGDHPMTVHLITRWTIGGLVADRFRSGRVFVAGDAAHRHPPTGALGLTSALHDVHNLCWKIAYRLRGWAGDSLLDTYEAERKPVDVRNVKRSLENSRAYAKMSHLLGFSDPNSTVVQRWSLLRRMWSGRPEDEEFRREVLEVMAAQSQEFREHDVEYGFRHLSTAVIDDGSDPEPIDDFRIHVPSTRPGHPLPHAWLEDWHGRRLSTLDLVTLDRFLLIIGEDGSEWRGAAAQASAELNVPIDVVRIGHARGDVRDPRLRWQRVRGIESSGAVLVRPDRCVAFRSHDMPPNPGDVLTSALKSVLAM